MYANWNNDSIVIDHSSLFHESNLLNCNSNLTSMTDQTFFQYFNSSNLDHNSSDFTCSSDQYNYGSNYHHALSSCTNSYYSSPPSSPDLWDNYVNECRKLANCDNSINNSNHNNNNSNNTNNSNSNVNNVNANLDNHNVIATKRQLIKEGLKVTIQSKRVALGLQEIDYDYLESVNCKPCISEPCLNPEDEERKRRRRERNKVAATKCRNKKKVHVNRLCQESQSLEIENNFLKEEIKNLEREQAKLMEILQKHLPFCCLITIKSGQDDHQHFSL